ncbi:MAG: CRISPR-associated endonuclease Cas2 [Longimicrobiales bacterium]
MNPSRRRYLVAYDISDDKRRDTVFQEMHGFGDWAQYSVFLCELNDVELVRMRTTLREAIHEDEDQILLVDLGRAHHPLEHSIEVLGKSYEPAVRSFIV